MTSVHHVVKTETIASIDRLLYLMYTGDTSKQPVRMWRCFKLTDSLHQNGWPYFDPIAINLQDLSIEIARWPYRNAYNEVRRYFVQSSSIGYHYGPQVEAHCESSLSAGLLQNQNGPHLYKGILKNVGYIIEHMYYREVYLFIQGGLQIAFGRALKTCHKNSVEMEGLKLANSERLRWQSSSKPLSLAYFPIASISHLIFRAFQPLLNQSQFIITCQVVMTRDYFTKLFDYLLSMNNQKEMKTSPFATASMRWIHEIKGLIQLFGTEVGGSMTRDS